MEPGSTNWVKCRPMQPRRVMTGTTKTMDVWTEFVKQGSNFSPSVHAEDLGCERMESGFFLVGRRVW